MANTHLIAKLHVTMIASAAGATSNAVSLRVYSILYLSCVNSGKFETFRTLCDPGQPNCTNINGFGVIKSTGRVFAS